ncbi:MAG: hypothetical protein AABY15_08015 [Nanoarchaeota archaeon]
MEKKLTQKELKEEMETSMISRYCLCTLCNFVCGEPEEMEDHFSEEHGLERKG